MALPVDPLELGRALIRCPSVTPVDAGALGVLESVLQGMGFACHRLTFADGGPEVHNLYARMGDGAPNFCFAGHTDVVPVGDAGAWSVDPFAADIRDGRLYGRGASDMKTGIACFVVAVDQFLGDRDGRFDGSISLLITGDEEGPAINGTVKVLEWLRNRGERLDACLVGEPTNPKSIGEMVKVGRRGSLNCALDVWGVQGHAAYPQRADNPIPRLLRMLTDLGGIPLDNGTDHFEPSTLTITSVDVGNSATNVIPARARAAFNIRFNDLHTSKGLIEWIESRCAAIDERFELVTESSGEAFLSPPGWLSAIISDAVKRTTGLTPELSTSGGTSDARFIRTMCPVAEFGMSGETAHKVDENVLVTDIFELTRIYRAVLDDFFARDR